MDTAHIVLITPRESSHGLECSVRELAGRWTDRGIRVSGVHVPPREDLRRDLDVFVLCADDRDVGPESFRIVAERGPQRSTLRVEGSDDTGLMYGAHEIIAELDRNPGAAPGDLPDVVSARQCAPALAVRSVNLFLHNRELEREWFFDPAHWERYFALMARSRLNQFTLTYAHQTAYLAPPFPFLVRVPGYDHVKTPGYSEEDRQQHLEAVRMISHKAQEWGIRFVIGIWLQHAHLYGKTQVEGLSYDDLFDYCPKALARFLGVCPGVRGVQFRMNQEAGIEEDDQARFFGAMLRAVRTVRDDLWIDLRAKGIREESIRIANDLGFDVTVSTKFWTEHMGLPFFMTQTLPVDSGRRYGYWDLLRHDRPYRMLYRLWTVGSNKILPWGDLQYTRRFVEACLLGDGIGFEICAPLSNKGFGNHAGGSWQVIEDETLRDYGWEFERYWPFLMSFGLQGYDPSDTQVVFSAEFRRRFGPEDGPRIKETLALASRIIPWLVACHLPSPSTFGYWPEMYAGGSSDVYATIKPSEWKRMYSIPDYVNDRMACRLQPLITPQEVAQRFEDMAARMDQLLNALPASSSRPSPPGSERKLMVINLRLLASIGLYHAARFRSALQYWWFKRTGDRAALREAIDEFEEALAQWRSIVALTDGVYYGHMVFNRPPDQVGHWKDELPFLEHEMHRLRRIDALYAESLASGARPPLLPAEASWYELPMEWEERGGVIRRRAGQPMDVPPIDSSTGYRAEHLGYTIGRRYQMEKAESIVRTALDCEWPPAQEEPRPPRPERVVCTESGGPRMAIESRDVSMCRSGLDLAIRATVRGPERTRTVELHYRRMHQAEDWVTVRMRDAGLDGYEGVIPGSAIDPGWDLLYAISTIDETGARDFYPDLDGRPPYVVVRVEDA